MSHIISKITFKIVRLFLAALLLFALYFAGITWYLLVEKLKHDESVALVAQSQTLARMLEEGLHQHIQNDANVLDQEAVAHLASKEIRRMGKLNPNKVEYRFLIRNPKAGSIPIEATAFGLRYCEWLQGINDPQSIYNAARQVFQNKNRNKHFIYHSETIYPGEVHNVSVSLFAEKDLKTIIHHATRAFYIQVLGIVFALLLVGLIVHRYLKRIISHEVLSKRKLDEYAQVAAQRSSHIETLSFVLSKSENLILLTDRNGRIQWLNESASRKNNYSNSELKAFIGRELAEVSHYPKIQEVIINVLTTKEKYVYEAKSYDADNKEFWASTTVTPILNEQGEVEKLLFIDADITQLKHAEAEIEKLAGFASENSNPALRIEQDGIVSYTNEPGEKVLKKWEVKLNTKVKGKVLELVDQAIEEQCECSINLQIEKRIFKMRFMPVKNKSYIHVYGEDITEAKYAQMVSTEKTLELEKFNLNITDSINYARRIQESILPGEDQIRRYFKDAFAIIMPKDIVSGDFFWVHELVPQEQYLLALADCTGHGVPGAMMSIIGHSLLNEIVDANGLTQPDSVLKTLNREVIKSLRQKSHGAASDGMDISMMHVNLSDMSIQFSGAYQSIYWMNSKLNVIKGDRKPIGGMHHDANRDFNCQQFKVSKGDCIYLLSDGMTDQFGGPQNKKFLSKRIKSLIEQNHKYSMQSQSIIFKNAFESWKGSHDQIDDASIIGIKF